MKVAFDNEIFINQKFGGISRYFTNLILNFNEESNIIKIICPYNTNKYLQDFDQTYFFGKKTEIRSINFFKKYFNKELLKKRLNKYQPDIIHETFFKNDLFKTKKAKIIVTIHDLIHEIIPSEKYPYKTKIPKIYAETYKRADHFICVSKNTKRDLQNIHGIPDNKITVIYHGIDHYVPKKNTDTNIRLKKIKPYILFVGWRGWYKNFENYIKSISINKNIYKQFNLVFFGGGSFSKKENEIINNSNIKESNIFHFQGNDDLLSYAYQNAYLFVYPSKYEGFGFPPLEALANNCPVVTSNNSSMPEILDNSALFFDPYSFEDMSYKIDELINNDDLRSKLLINGSKRLEFFKWKKTSKNTLNLYKSLI